MIQLINLTYFLPLLSPGYPDHKAHYSMEKNNTNQNFDQKNQLLHDPYSFFHTGKSLM